MKKLFTILVSIFLLGAIPVGIYLVGQNQELRKKAAPATTLAITPATIQKNVGDEFSLEVTIDSGENQVVAAELHIVFDPSKLEMETISNGPLFPNILASGAIEGGTASITVGAADVKQPIKGTGTVAVVKLKAIAKTDSPVAVKLASNTFVGGLGEGAVNVLVGTTPATVTIMDTQPQTTPEPTPPAEQDLAPQGTLTPTPTATSSAQISPTASPSASLAIVSPASEGTTNQDRPVIKGKAPAGSIVTITVYSTPQTATVTADENGNWVYTPDTSLEAGSHNIVASVTDENGQTHTATSEFVVASATLEGDPVPVSGTVETTLLLLIMGTMFIIIGLYWSNLANWTN